MSSTDTLTLKKYGRTMAIALVVIGGIVLLKQRHDPRWFFYIAAVFFLVSLSVPRLLHPVYIIWMRIGHVLGWINTRLILIILFYGVMTPIGWVMKLFRGDPLDIRITKNTSTYWIPNDAIFERESYKRQF